MVRFWTTVRLLCDMGSGGGPAVRPSRLRNSLGSVWSYLLFFQRRRTRD